MRQNPHVRICGGPGSATTLVYPTTIRQVQQAGRRQWKKDSGYHQQARMENAFFRYKLIIGESLRARSRAGQETEAILACNILNQMTQLGRPASYAIGR